MQIYVNRAKRVNINYATFFRVRNKLASLLKTFRDFLQYVANGVTVRIDKSEIWYAKTRRIANYKISG